MINPLGDCKRLFFFTQAKKATGKYQESEGPAIAEEIMKKYDISTEVLEHVCKIIANHHSAKEIDTIEFRVIWDADWLVNIPADFPDASEEELQEIIDKRLNEDFSKKNPCANP